MTSDATGICAYDSIFRLALGLGYIVLNRQLLSIQGSRLRDGYSVEIPGRMLCLLLPQTGTLSLMPTSIFTKAQSHIRSKSLLSFLTICEYIFLCNKRKNERKKKKEKEEKEKREEGKEKEGRKEKREKKRKGREKKGEGKGRG